MKDYLDDNAKARQELERLRREVQELRGRPGGAQK